MERVRDRCVQIIIQKQTEPAEAKADEDGARYRQVMKVALEGVELLSLKRCKLLRELALQSLLVSGEHRQGV